MASNPTQGMDVCLCLFSVKGVLPTVLDYETEMKQNVSRMPYASSGSNRYRRRRKEEEWQKD
jgi:hypothetical protein